MQPRLLKSFVHAGLLGCLLLGPVAHAGLFDDDQARQAVLDLRAKVDSSNTRIEGLTRNLLDLNNQVQQLQQALDAERGQNQELQNQLATLQKNQKDYYADLDARLKKLEPQQVTVDGVTGTVQPGEKTEFDAALNQFRNGDFKGASGSLSSFVKHYPNSPYLPDAEYWLGNTYYALRDYKASNNVLQNVVSQFPNHPRAPQALLAIATNQQETGQKVAARRTLQTIISKYADSDSAQVAKQRLAKLR
ncbi:MULTISPECIES: tol-pal system protein YbgF [Pandoraea]|uniref:Cell division coordinator CpoB n=1 Tax=Pandoraea thiooxydans TaxID=445709 RepID=A0A0G3EUA5_9BURK|nr:MULTISPECIES: tol-pal system protein YbgF [Pandoraea]MBU6491788.1 tol-pal system protein YbgF [Burkholderiales bacterium]AKJ70535.2 tol-pal system protein YbgF [Pandoraea thiooxydans]APR96339.1 tol-pal system protein YbgF [Pandoraea thiooxydans]MDE2288163.1 tol-pal system protein YbgF [Burkholderiales bacterium]MDE2611403.1 tol-pal system protein YbgF [Burkholderiales bacterium]